MKHWLVCLGSCLLWTCCASQGGCEEPPDVDFGEVVSDEKVNYQEHDRIQYRCYSGYALEGSEWISCNGRKWTPPPKCLASCAITRQQLDAKNLLLLGGRRRSRVIQSNHTLEFMCREGYVITTPSVRKCVDGHMDLPSCISERGKNCSRPPPIENGDVITLFQKEYLSGSWVEFKCQRYYAMEGPNRSFCDNGTWTKVPACLEPCVLTLADSQQIVVKGSSYNNGFQRTYLPRGDSVELSCKPGYVLEANPSQAAFLIQCSEEPVVYPKCKEITCKAPQVTNGNFRPQRNMYQGGDLIRIECNQGLHLENGQNIAECTSSGWSPSPQCGKKPCGHPGDIQFGSFELKNEEAFVFGARVVYRCDDGYQMVSQRDYRDCRVDGWSNDVPHCEEKPCGGPPTVHDSKLDRRTKKTYSSGETVTYVCQPGFGANRPLTVTCRRGEWTGPPICEDMTCRELPAIDNADVLRGEDAPYLPGHHVQYQCHEGFKMNGSDTIICENKRWSQPPVCNDATCPPAPSVDHGNLDGPQKERYLPFEKVHYRCDPGKSLLGPQSVTCLNKQWTEKPECRAAGGRCGRPPVVENGDILEDAAAQFPPNSVVNYKCQRFYIMRGQSAVRCANGHWSEAPTCVAPCTATEEDMRRNKIQLKWRSADKLYLESGDEMEFICRPGFMPDPSSPSFRVQCREGKLEYPRCIEFCTLNKPRMQNLNLIPQSEMKIPYGYDLEVTCKSGYRNAQTSPPLRVSCREGNLEYPNRCVRG